jgi:SAM-dependent methyltransferase
VLDVGCGSGASAIPAAEKVSPGGHVLGVDLAENLLALARAKAEARGLHNAEFRVGDMENLGFPDGHFDTIISVFSIFFVPNMEQQVRELWRMVRSGGQLAITTWGEHFCQPMQGRWEEIIKRVRPDLYTSFQPWERLATPEALRQLLVDSGVLGAEVAAEKGIQPLKSPDDWWLIALGSSCRWTIEQLTPELAALVREDNLKWAADNGIDGVQTNVVYAVATKH